MLGKIEGRRRTGQQKMRWLDGLTDSMHMGLDGMCETFHNKATGEGGVRDGVPHVGLVFWNRRSLVLSGCPASAPRERACRGRTGLEALRSLREALSRHRLPKEASFDLKAFHVG